MYGENERSRTRPRVSKACERCKIKKAKCDGLKPCHRCNLDKAPCTYKMRRKTESADITQRYTNLLLQHHADLTAGLIKLYSRSLKGQRWAGSPVEEVNGSPSVHRILEELGVLETEDEAPAEMVSTMPPRRLPIPPEKLKPRTTGVPSKIRKAQRSTPCKAPHGLESPGYSPISASSTSAPFPPASPSSNPHQESSPSPPRYATRAFSPPPSGVPSQRSSRCDGTPMPWASPEFSEELFTTPVPSPSCSPSMRLEEAPLSTQIRTRYLPSPGLPVSSDVQPSRFDQQDVYAPEDAYPALAMPFGSSSLENDGCNAGYFYDATSCGAGVSTTGPYHSWDGSATNTLGYLGLGQDYTAWD